MKHSDLKKGDIILVRSMFNRVSPELVFKVTKKTVETKYNECSSMINRHGRYFGNALFVVDMEKYADLQNLDTIISEAQKKRDEVTQSLERITFDEG